MRSHGAVLLSGVLLIVPPAALSQTLAHATLYETFYQTLDKVTGKPSYVTQYSIACVFSAQLDSVEAVNPRSWKVVSGNDILEVEGITWTRFSPELVEVVGGFAGLSNLTVQFKDGSPVLVSVDSTTVGKTRWGFGKGRALDLNIRRLMNQTSLFAFDYALSTKILEHNLTVPNGALWFRSLSLEVVSDGTFGSDDTVRNGSQSSIQLSANPFYFVGGLIYAGQLSVAYQIETRMNAASNKLLDVVNHSLKLGIQAELPYSNYPMFALHSVTGYARLAMPLTVSLNYLPEGEDASGNSTNARWDYGVRYELAFSPYLIIQGEWRGSKFSAPPVGIPSQTSYYAVAFAQDLDVVKKTLGFLTLLLGDETAEGKHFIFYRISSGRRAPAFQDVKEQSVGLGTYF